MLYFGRLSFPLLVATTLLVGCPQVDDSAVPIDSMESLSAPNGFMFDMTSTVLVEIAVIGMNGVPSPNTTINVYSDDNFDNNPTRLITSGLTDGSGLFKRNIAVPARINKLIIEVSTIGIANVAHVPIIRNVAEYTFGTGEPTNELS
jgi:hypothetical protein